MNVETTLRRHLADPSLLGTAAATVGADDNLFDLIDSLQMLRMVAHLEKTFRIEIDDFEMVPLNLQSIKALGELVRRKVK
jgi:acyl carrier protein